MSTGTSPPHQVRSERPDHPNPHNNYVCPTKITAQRNGRDGGRALTREKEKAIIPLAPNFETVTRRRIGTGTYGISDF